MVPPATAAPPPVSAAAYSPTEPATPPLAAPPVVAALTTFEGQAVFRVLEPGAPGFRAGRLFRFQIGSRSTEGREL